MNLNIDVNIKVSEEAMKAILETLKVVQNMQLNNVVESECIGPQGDKEKVLKEKSTASNVTRNSKNSKGTKKEEASNTKEQEDKKISLEDVKTKLAALSQDGKQAQVKALITEFGAKKLSDIPPEKYVALLEKADEL